MIRTTQRQKQLSTLLVLLFILLLLYWRLHPTIQAYWVHGLDDLKGRLEDADTSTLLIGSADHASPDSNGSEGQHRADTETISIQQPSEGLESPETLQDITGSSAFSEAPIIEDTDTHVSTTSSASFAIISDLPFKLGNMEPPDHQYTRAVVMARTTHEDVSWLDEHFGDDPLLQKAVYTVDDPIKPYVLPANKGNEVMAYLTFIIDFYSVLPDVCIFIHAHLTAWHNNELLDMSSAKMLKHLNLRKVVREGYFNLRCHHHPSCPDHIYPLAKNHSAADIPEESRFEEAWREILPHEAVPEVLSQPCCAQFAVSRERIQQLPREQYVHFRKWITYTTMENRIAGRVWEYIYQYIWAGVPQFCPPENICYCDGYGICFGGEEEYSKYYAKKGEIDDLKKKGAEQIDAGGDASSPVDYVSQIDELKTWLEQERQRAWQRGIDPSNRALEAGRPYVPGDGF